MSVVSSSFRARVRSNIERPVAAVFTKTGLSPNALTVIGFGIAVIGAWLAASQLWVMAALIVAFGAVFDLFDGALARATNKVSKVGGFLDSVFDRAGESVVYIGCCWACLSVNYDLGAILSCAAMATSFMVSYTRAKSESLGFSSGTGMGNVGLAPREIRTAILVVGLLAIGWLGGLGFAFIPQDGGQLSNTAVESGRLAISATMGAISVLATITTLQRIYFVYRQIEPNQQEVLK
ncbi:MAG: CDP-alcohol phosphatidyltransferase family protein [Candidatus Limnocylindrales bacterium]